MIGTNLAITTKRFVPLGGASTDPDAQAFITAAGITDATQKSAVNQLVLDLKSANIWTKMKAIYPVVGGSASTHKWNLKDPRDLDAAFRLTFATGWTHASTGMTPNGTSAYADTFLNSLSNLIGSSNHLSFYSRTTTVGTECEIGNADTVTQKFFQLRAAGNFASGGSGAIVNFTTTLDAKGFWLGSKRANNDREVYLNGVSQSTITTNDATTLFNGNVYIGARNQSTSTPTIALYSTKECAFASIGDGLSDTEAANFYTAVNAYQTTLGRNV
jgi:hypothetical protein